MAIPHIGQYVKLEGKDETQDSVFTVKHLKGDVLGTIEVKEVGGDDAELIFNIDGDTKNDNKEYFIEAIELAEAHAFKHTDAHKLLYRGDDKNVIEYAKEAGFHEEDGDFLIHSHEYADVRN